MLELEKNYIIDRSLICLIHCVVPVSVQAQFEETTDLRKFYPHKSCNPKFFMVQCLRIICLIKVVNDNKTLTP